MKKINNDIVKGVRKKLKAIDWPQYYHSDNVELKWMNQTTKAGNYYDGQYDSSSMCRHGMGFAVWTDGSIYEGFYQ